MKVGDLVKARHKTGLLGIIIGIQDLEDEYHEFTEYTILWSDGNTGELYESR
tara:strand:+ start:157 stop:312 length:156 start_codon:yes stop_codon:yes gene_type:complete